MLKVLLKKQLAEVFRSYFYDAKKSRMRSKWAIAAWFVFFFVIMVGLLGGMFTALALSLCGSLVQAGVGWLYFALIGGIAILLGAFGSVFNTYSGLYLAKDNDLLLSLPIPVRTIIAARLANVYLMGAMYSAVVLIPALIVYWIITGVSAAKMICGLVLLLVVTVFVLLLSCLLGWVVAKISLRLKNKSFITVLVSLVFIGAYYFFYFKANDLIRDLILHAESYAEKIRGAAYGLYLFGRMGEGNWLVAAIFFAVTAILAALIWTVLSQSFLSIATDSGKTEKARYVEKAVKEKTPFRALLGKEFARFASSANYMLNCGLGVLLIPAGGILLLFRGRQVCEVLGGVFAGMPDTVAILLCTMLWALSSMNDMTVPSVSLEGKSIWIPQSLPVDPKTVIRAKLSVQLILTVIPMLFAAACAAIIVPAAPVIKILLLVTPLMYVVFSSIFGMLIGLRMPLLNWTNELAPIKQSGAVAIILFGSWAICAVFAALYLLFAYKIGAVLYLVFWLVFLAAVTLIMLHWLNTKGAESFATL